jgi:hypothetical protein
VQNLRSKSSILKRDGGDGVRDGVCDGVRPHNKYMISLFNTESVTRVSMCFYYKFKKGKKEVILDLKGVKTALQIIRV